MLSLTIYTSFHEMLMFVIDTQLSILLDFLSVRLPLYWLSIVPTENGLDEGTSENFRDTLKEHHETNRISTFSECICILSIDSCANFSCTNLYYYVTFSFVCCSHSSLLLFCGFQQIFEYSPFPCLVSL